MPTKAKIIKNKVFIISLFFVMLFLSLGAFAPVFASLSFPGTVMSANFAIQSYKK